MDENANVRPYVRIAGSTPMFIPEGVTPDGMNYWIDYLDQMYGLPRECGGPPFTLVN